MTAFANSVCFKIAEKKFETLSKANFYTPLVWFQTTFFLFPLPWIFLLSKNFSSFLFGLTGRGSKYPWECSNSSSCLESFDSFPRTNLPGAAENQKKKLPWKQLFKENVVFLLLYKVTVQLMTTLLSGWPSAIWGTVFWWVRSQPANMTPLRQRPPQPPPPGAVAFLQLLLH